MLNLSKQSAIIVGIIASLVLGGALVMIYRELRPAGGPAAPTQAWFYDLNTGKLFAAPNDAVPPIPAPSGLLPDGSPAGVLAHVFTCTTCDDQNLKVLYLESRTPEGHAKMIAWRTLPAGSEAPVELRNAQEEGVLVRRPTDDHWSPQQSLEGRTIEDNGLVNLCPENRQPSRCFPVSH